LIRPSKHRGYLARHCPVELILRQARLRVGRKDERHRCLHHTQACTPDGLLKERV
jgi:hypothetical protein